MLPLSRLHLLAQVVQQLCINPVTVVSDVVSGPFGAFVQATTCCPPASWQICGPVSVPGPVCRSTKLLAPHVCKPKTVKESMGESHVSCKEGIQTSAGPEGSIDKDFGQSLTPVPAAESVSTSWFDWPDPRLVLNTIWASAFWSTVSMSVSKCTIFN